MKNSNQLTTLCGVANFLHLNGYESRVNGDELIISTHGKNYTVELDYDFDLFGCSAESALSAAKNIVKYAEAIEFKKNLHTCPTQEQYEDCLLGEKEFTF